MVVWDTFRYFLSHNRLVSWQFSLRGILSPKLLALMRLWHSCFVVGMLVVWRVLIYQLFRTEFKMMIGRYLLLYICLLSLLIGTVADCRLTNNHNYLPSTSTHHASTSDTPPPLLSLFNFNELTRWVCCLGCCDRMIVDDGEKQETAPRKAMFNIAMKRCIVDTIISW